MSLTIAIPTKQSIHARCILSLMQSMTNVKGMQVKIRILPGKSNITHARSILLTEWFDGANEDDLFLFIDADQTFTQDDIMACIHEIQNSDADVVCGVYCNSAGMPNVHAKDPMSFFRGSTKDVFYSATGFMMISKPVLYKCMEFMKNESIHKNGNIRYWISQREQNIIPFFRQRFINSETMPGSGREWLGEDYGFCWLVRHSGGKIHSLIRPTVGHEVAQVRFFYPSEFNSKTWSEKSLVYFCGHGNVEVHWSPKEKG